MEKSGKPTFAKLDPVLWDGLLDEWQTSGISQQAFCKHRSISFHTFAYWRSKKRNRKKPARQTIQTTSNTFAKAAITSPPPRQTSDSLRLLCTTGAQLIIPLSMPKPDLEHLLKQLGISAC